MKRFVEIGEKQIITTEYFLDFIFLTVPCPGAPPFVRISNPPWYEAKTSPSPVLHLISAS